MEFTELESRALALFADEYGSEFPGLAAQLASAHPTARENTRSGFFTDIAIDKNGFPLSHIDSPLDGLVVRPEGMRGNLELLLFFKDGYANLLEGYSVEGENTLAIDFDIGHFTELGLLWPSRKPIA